MIGLLVIASLTLQAQHYIRGEVLDKHGDKLQNVKITSVRTKNVYRSDIYGGFGFPSSVEKDTLLFTTDGFESLRMPVSAHDFVSAALKTLSMYTIRRKEQVNATSYQYKQHQFKTFQEKDESYSSIYENNFILSQYVPEIRFGANSNRAAYSNVRRLINEMEGALPPHAVRIEELLNYFQFFDYSPGGDSTFSVHTQRSSCPWQPNNQLLFVNLQAKKIQPKERKPTNLVLLIDISGSMEMPNKLPLIKAGLQMLIKNLQSTDTISLVTYGANVQLVFEGISGSNQKFLKEAIAALNAGGPTPGESAIRLAFQVARRRYFKNGNNRILMAADGDFNVGMTTEKQLESLILQQKESGIYLSCIGVGIGNYKDSKLAILAKKGNGSFAYIDTEQEAEKVMVTDLLHTLFTVADDVQILANFSATQTKAYRLIGFDNEIYQFKDSCAILEGGDIGSGHSVTAIFEIAPSTNMVSDNSPFANIEISFQLPGDTNHLSIKHFVQNPLMPFESIDPGYRKSAVLALFGMKLRKSGYAAGVKWGTLQKMAHHEFDKNNTMEKELIALIHLAKKLYTHPRRFDSGY
ncbi:MAG: hypothetical protein RLY16_2617 [Bacteroidota bacterium]